MGLIIFAKCLTIFVNSKNIFRNNDLRRFGFFVYVISIDYLAFSCVFFLSRATDLGFCSMCKV